MNVNQVWLECSNLFWLEDGILIIPGILGLLKGGPEAGLQQEYFQQIDEFVCGWTAQHGDADFFQIGTLKQLATQPLALDKQNIEKDVAQFRSLRRSPGGSQQIRYETCV